MPLIPNIIERTLFFELNQAPGPLLDIWSAVAFRAVLAGIRVGLFETLNEEIMSAEMLAKKLTLNEEGALILLETLRSLGYLEKREESYFNSVMTSKWLVGSSGMDLSAGFRYWAAIMPLFDNLEDSLRFGSPPVNMYDWLEDQPQVTQDFQEYMVPLAKFAVNEVSGRLKLPNGAKRLLDIGGGHAIYSIALCQKKPSLSAKVFDTQEALKAGRKNISEAGMESRIQVQEGNFFTDDLGSGYDVALLFNISHGMIPEQNIALLQKVAKALNPGGLAVILEQFGTNLPLPMSQAANNILGLSYYHLLGGQVYTHAQVVSWFQAAGYGNIQRLNLRKVPGNSLVIGVSEVN
jgi:hypothetical protein